MQRIRHIRNAFVVIALAIFAASGPTSAQDDSKITPLGLPPLTPAVADRRLALLGEVLFSDRRLSLNNSVSCASCHLPTNYFVDSRVHAIGVHKLEGTRNTPSLLNVAYMSSLFWDGRAGLLEQQVRLPLLNPREHGLVSDAEVAKRVSSISHYREEFRRLGYPKITLETVSSAIASYERTLRSGDSAFDRYAYGHDLQAMSPSAIRGLSLFKGKAKCAACHLIESDFALFTDFSYHSSPLGLQASVNAHLVELTQRTLQVRDRNDREQLNRLIADNRDVAALGRFVVTLDPKDIGAFRTPSLRDVAQTAPYFHDGSVMELPEAVERELYNRGSPARYPIVMSVTERADLLAFLMSLSGAALPDPHSRAH